MAMWYVVYFSCTAEIQPFVSSGTHIFNKFPLTAADKMCKFITAFSHHFKGCSQNDKYATHSPKGNQYILGQQTGHLTSKIIYIAQHSAVKLQ